MATLALPSLATARSRTARSRTRSPRRPEEAGGRSLRRVLLSFDGVDHKGREDARRLLVGVPASLRLVADFVSHAKTRVAAVRPLVGSVGGFALPLAQPLAAVVRDGEVVALREASGQGSRICASVPSPARAPATAVSTTVAEDSLARISPPESATQALPSSTKTNSETQASPAKRPKCDGSNRCDAGAASPNASVDRCSPGMLAELDQALTPLRGAAQRRRKGAKSKALTSPAPPNLADAEAEVTTLSSARAARAAQEEIQRARSEEVAGAAAIGYLVSVGDGGCLSHDAAPAVSPAAQAPASVAAPSQDAAPAVSSAAQAVTSVAAPLAPPIEVGTITKSSDGSAVVQHRLLGDIYVPSGQLPEKLIEKKLRTLQKAVQRQVEYYFGEKNWARDEHLRSLADSDGFVAITEVASFERLSALTKDVATIAGSVVGSELVEISSCGTRLRQRSGSASAPKMVPAQASVAAVADSSALGPPADAGKLNANVTFGAESKGNTGKDASLDDGNDNRCKPDGQNTVFVGGLAWACTQETLHKDFSECGRILDLKMMTDAETGRSRGYAFITFADEASVDAALRFDGEDYGGRPLRVQRSGASKGKGSGAQKGKQGGNGKAKGKATSRRR